MNAEATGVRRWLWRSVAVTILLTVLGCGALAPGAAGVDETPGESPLAAAQWLADPVFDGLEPVDLYHKQKAPFEAPPTPQNIHTYFRNELRLDAVPLKATLHYSADDYAQVYINGGFVTQGPEPGYPFAYPYVSVDVTGRLRAGVNCLAAHVYYQGLINRVWYSGDRRAGFIAVLEVETQSGRRSFVTDASWRCRRSAVYSGGRTFGYDTQFAEDIDLRELLPGWKKTGFDASDWETPATADQGHVFARQLTPPLEVFRMDPAVSEHRGGGRYFYDFGSEVVGHTRVRLPGGHEGAEVIVHHGEELRPDGGVRYQLRANCVYEETVTLAAEPATAAFYDYKGFRYIEVLDCPEEPEVWVDARRHPYPVDAARLDTSKDTLDAIWELCANGVRWGAQGVMVDCPTREKGQYLGDVYIAGRSHLRLTGDPSLQKKALLSFHQSQEAVCPGVLAVAPGAYMQEIAEYSLLWPMALLDYYRQTGDESFARTMAAEGFPPLFEYYGGYESEHGLITGMNEKWVLVDWPANLRDGFDYDYAETRENAVLNAFYYASLDAAADLLSLLGEDGAGYRAKADRVRRAYQRRLFNDKTGLFVDAPGSEHSALHSNALPLAFGIATEAQTPAVIELIREKRLACGVYIAPFVIEACYRAGEPELAYDLLTSDDPHSWQAMLKAGATTCLEAWSPDLKGNCSWCHPWSSGPVFIITDRVFGVTPAAPGWTSIRFEPHWPEGLETGELELPLPCGRVIVRRREGGRFELFAPPGVHVDMAEGVKCDVRRTLGAAPLELTDAHRSTLEKRGWRERVGGGLGVWVSTGEQAFRLIRGGEVIWQRACSTAAKGPGQQMGSNRTPLGWHRVAHKFGDGAPLGQVFRARRPTSEVWKPGQIADEDLVLTRILWLEGVEPGLNQGGQVDSMNRYIYIHGTNEEERIGQPASHGCVRLRNHDAVQAYEMIPAGTPVLITLE